MPARTRVWPALQRRESKRTRTHDERLARTHRISGATGKSDRRTRDDGARARRRIASFHAYERGRPGRNAHRTGRAHPEPGREPARLRETARDGVAESHRDGAYGDQL